MKICTNKKCVNYREDTSKQPVPNHCDLYGALEKCEQTVLGDFIVETEKYVNPEDKIHNPPHYTQGGIQPLDYIISNKMTFCEGNIIKYVTRYKHKNGLEDLFKAKEYLDRLIKEVTERGC